MESIACVVCPVCSATTNEVYFGEVDQSLDRSGIGSSRTSVAPGRILRCRKCKFGFRQLRSSPEQLRNLYKQMDPRVYKSETEGRKRTANKHLEIVLRYIRSGSLLDIGCASGLFLLHALEAGWEVTGIEPNEKLCEQARAALGARGEVRCATLELAGLETSFDVATLWDVLEHVPDPVAFLRDCRRLLRPGGWLFINVPDLDSVEARIMGRRWPLLLPEHLNYFNRQSLNVCANKALFSLVGYGRRHAWFSLRYVAYRIRQHNLPGAAILVRCANSFLGDVMIPVSLGETYAVFRRE
jgi:SAM-dependent methyltransferase